MSVPKKVSLANLDKHIASYNWYICLLLCIFIIGITVIIGIIICKSSVNEIKEFAGHAAVYIAGVGTVPIITKIIESLSKLFKS